MRATYLIAILTSFLFGQFSNAQVVEGKVTDQNTGEPVAFANVFFAGTLIGDVTDLEGKFSFTIPKQGKYELTVSYVGYLEYSKEIVSTDELPFFEISLAPEVIELKDIQVEADTTGWKRNYPAFKELFIGETENAAQVNIENPRDIFLFFDRVENGLFAHSRKEIFIENEALGYRIGYKMKDFSMEYRSGRFASFGIPRFQEMVPKNKGQVKRWEKARARTYRGSFNHFLRSFKDNTFVEEGFVVQELFRIPNPERPPESLIREKLASLGVGNSGSNIIVLGSSTNTDSLSYWRRMRRMPAVIDSLGMTLTDNSLIESNTLMYTGYLKITYTKEREDEAFSRYRRGGGVDNKQTSIVNFLDNLTIYDNEYYDAGKVLFEGYMGWSSRIAEMLPLEYLPASD